MHNYIPLVEDDPEIIFQTLHAQYLSSAFLLHADNYIVCYGSDCRGRISIAYNEVVRYSRTYRAQVQGYDILRIN